MKELIKYTELADRKVIDTFNGAGKELAQAELLFSHLLNAQHIWIARINDVKPHFEIMQRHSKDQFEQIHKKNFVGFNKIISSVDLNSPIEYTNSKGESFMNLVSDILFHVVNHSTYHRGQIATQFRLNEVEPPVTDYIFLKRKGEF